MQFICQHRSRSMSTIFLWLLCYQRFLVQRIYSPPKPSRITAQQAGWTTNAWIFNILFKLLIQIMEEICKLLQQFQYASCCVQCPLKPVTSYLENSMPWKKEKTIECFKNGHKQVPRHACVQFSKPSPVIDRQRHTEQLCSKNISFHLQLIRTL